MQTTPPMDASGKQPPDGPVGSDRVLAVLLELARHPSGVGLEEMARSVAGSKPTVHRALASLRRAGLAEQDGRGHYLLGDEFVRIAFAFHEARPEHVRIQGVLETLAARFGETVHYAVLDGRDVVYRSKVDAPSGPVRLTSSIGGRNPAHATGVGKLLLSYRLHSLEDVTGWIGDRPLERPTDNTIVTAAGLHRELAEIRERGYSVDDQENEPGVNCLALPAFLTSAIVPSGAISISALAYRTPLPELVRRVAEMRSIIAGQKSQTQRKEAE
ncbi:IclR family transcriptional regulator [Sinomonas terrae]|uniref:IclR family transcriptional regulator n=1 Tax=Sinomonas terrae TaxID=2908838 RepID=A0ABS9U8C1_9MICC|nr:IclR family transcriptional regulator [Sinomonas terrae]MCH6472540.1 IclR family transcriptional regulator [Sinomonas terrae]